MTNEEILLTYELTRQDDGWINGPLGMGARVVLDSQTTKRERLCTMEVRLWKSLVAEFNTHRILSRLSASSRAIPLRRFLANITERPFIPKFRKNATGMVPGDYLTEEEQYAAMVLWLQARDAVIPIMKQMADPNGLNIHKQWLNRPLEPWMYTTILVSSTDWRNLFALRIHPNATDELKEAVRCMSMVLSYSYLEGNCQTLKDDDYHLPYVFKDDRAYFEEKELIKLSIGRCCTVSYDNLGNGVDPLKDIARYDTLLNNGHMSPFEMVGKALAGSGPSGNFTGGWIQERKTLVGEDIFVG